MQIIKVLGIAVLVVLAQGCGHGESTEVPPAVTVGPRDDGTTVRGVIAVTVAARQSSPLTSLFTALMPYAYAATGSAVVTFASAPAVTFTIDATGLGASGFTGNTLGLGSVSLATLDDNNLKVCGVGGSSKCGQAIIRVYTVGSVAGFVNTAEGYGAPVYAGALAPATPVGLTSSGSVQVQTVTIANNKNRLRLSDFPAPTYPVSADFANAGSGSYAMTFVIEYALGL